MPAVNVNVDPATDDIFTLPDNDKVISDLLTETLDEFAVDAMVTVAAVPLLASKNVRSALVGADAPPAPPDVADQLAVFVLSQVPDPPTQYLFAIVHAPLFNDPAIYKHCASRRNIGSQRCAEVYG